MLDNLRAVKAQIHGLPAWHSFMKTTRNGHTGIGKSFEDWLGISENNLQESDLLGVELKVKREESSSPLTLFTCAPSSPRSAIRTLLTKYGYPRDEGGVGLYIGLTTTRVWENSGHRFSVAVSDEGGVQIMVNGEIAAHWTLEKMSKAFDQKLKNAMAQLNADSIEIDGIERFRLSSCNYYWNASAPRLVQLIRDGVVSVHLRAKMVDGKVRDHGTAFRINKNKVVDLYEHHEQDFGPGC